MIIALEIAGALSLAAMITVYMSSLPKPKRVRIPVKDGRIRAGDTGSRQR